MITIEFDLPHGYEDDKGNVHTHVVMRRLRGEDEIAVFQDNEVVKLRTYKFDLKSSDPVELLHLKSAMIVYHSVLFARLIISIGEITTIDRNKVRKLSPMDIDLIADQFAQLHGLNREAATLPFGLGTNLPSSSPTQ